MAKNCDNCIYSGRPSYEYPCTVCVTAYDNAPSKWESAVPTVADMVGVVRCKDCKHYLWHDWEKFIEDYSFEDKEEVYTNGSMLIPVFRVEQMIEHYFGRGWIPVTERLPEENGRYLCNVKSFAFSGCFYRTILQYVEGGFVEGHIYTDAVTHWMPLPEPPKEVSK